MQHDLELLERYRSTDDRAALDTLFARHYPAVYQTLLHLLHNSMDDRDLAQSTFLAALESTDRFRPCGLCAVTFAVTAPRRCCPCSMLNSPHRSTWQPRQRLRARRCLDFS